jgi:hypothetical protein
VTTPREHDNKRKALVIALILPPVQVALSNREWPVWGWLLYMATLGVFAYFLALFLLNYGDRSRR